MRPQLQRQVFELLHEFLVLLTIRGGLQDGKHRFKDGANPRSAGWTGVNGSYLGISDHADGLRNNNVM